MSLALTYILNSTICLEYPLNHDQAHELQVESFTFPAPVSDHMRRTHRDGRDPLHANVHAKEALSDAFQLTREVGHKFQESLN